MKSNNRVLPLLLVFLVFCLCCEGQEKNKKHKHKKAENQALSKKNNSIAPVNTTAADCDTALWNYVYNPERLQVIDRCKTVTGTIEESHVEEDGDQHILLKLDSGQEGLLVKKNKTKKQGYLVIEAVCVNKVRLKKVGTICKGYINHIQLPKLGDHVRITGSLVNDTHNGWNEIHPIMKIEKY
jgi:hypothetical protein